jgi:pimeloyl-ACP methyl ester carboxylesterase
MILLIPGMLNTAAIWADVIEGLGQRGLPRSELVVADVTKDASISAMAERAWAQLAPVASDRPVMLVGFSLGGYVALQMVAHAQRRVDAVAFVATTASPEPADNLANRERAMAALTKDFAKTVHGIATWGMHEPSEVRLAEVKAAMLPVGAAVAIQQTRAIMQRADHREALRAVQAPSLIIHGEQDRIVDPKGSRELAALLPHARLVSLANCGHMLPKERPVELAQALFELHQHINQNH